MPLQNRVTPLGELIANPARGLVYGNRGCLHDDRGRIRRAFAVKRWIACRLEFRGWHREPLMQPGRFTELFFLDEATAYAAGHRPCRMCRFEDYVAFVETWASLHPRMPTNADAIDARLHTERWDPERRCQRLHAELVDELPDGAFVLGEDGGPWLVLGDDLVRWSPAGYRERERRPHGGEATVVTPASLVGALRSDRSSLVPFLHPTTRLA